MEGMPESVPEVPVEKKEKKPITDEQCVEAMKTDNFRLVQEWYAQQEEKSLADPTIAEHLNLTMRLARLQIDAGLRETALDTLEAAHMDAMGQKDYDSARKLEDVMDNLKKSLSF